MNSEMHPINYKLSNDKNQFMLASAINTWVNLVSFNFSVGYLLARQRESEMDHPLNLTIN